MRLKNNETAGTDGFPVELFKTGCNELVGRLHQLIYTIWLEENMPNDGNLSVLCPVLRKGDPKICAKYSAISLLPIASKVLTSVLCERLNPSQN